MTNKYTPMYSYVGVTMCLLYDCANILIHIELLCFCVCACSFADREKAGISSLHSVQ